MNINDPASPPQETPLPRPANASRARRRQRGQLVVPRDAEGRAALLAAMARRSYPSYELFVYAVVCGAILGLGYVLDSQALLLFGILVAPLLLPWVGILLATITGSVRFFFETIIALLISAALVFVIGILAGFASRLFMPRTFNEAYVHSALWWPDLVVLAIGAVILTVSFIRSEDKPFLPSVMLAYEFFLPISAAGFGLGSGISHIWPNGLLVFFVHFAWATMFGIITLIAMRFMPSNLQGLIFTGGVSLVLIVLLLLLMTGGTWSSPFGQGIANSVPPPASLTNLPPVATSTVSLQVQGTLQPSPAPIIDTATPSPTDTLAPTPVPLTLEVTLPPTDIPTVTLTFEPTPVYARVHSSKGVVLRAVPAGKALTTLDDFSIVEVLPDTQNASNYTWAHVIATQNGARLTGWIVDLYLETSTPAPNSQPLVLPTITVTSTP